VLTSRRSCSPTRLLACPIFLTQCYGGSWTSTSERAAGLMNVAVGTTGLKSTPRKMAYRIKEVTMRAVTRAIFWKATPLKSPG